MARTSLLALAVGLATYSAMLSTKQLLYPGDAPRECEHYLMMRDTRSRGVVGASAVKVKAVADLTFYSARSRGGYTCSVMTGSQRQDAPMALGDRVSSILLTPETPTLRLHGLFHYVWIDCTDVEQYVEVAAVVCSAPAQRW